MITDFFKLTGIFFAILDAPPDRLVTSDLQRRATKAGQNGPFPRKDQTQSDSADLDLFLSAFSRHPGIHYQLPEVDQGSDGKGDPTLLSARAFGGDRLLCVYSRSVQHQF